MSPTKYFFDCEFIEGFKKPIFGKRRHFIDLISIGMVCEDGREYYAISNEFNPKDADDWVKENVLYPIMVKHGYTRNLSNVHNHRSYGHGPMEWIQERFGKSNEKIAQEIIEFVCFPGNQCVHTDVEFYGYYSDYDWVLLCSLFGRMSALPAAFPMYCRDIKQFLDQRLEDHYMTYLPAVDNQPEIKSNGNIELSKKLAWFKSLSEYPKQEEEHNALQDARWNKKLFDTIQQYFKR